MLSPREFVASYGGAARAKTSRPVWQLLLLGVCAGFFIGCGAVVSMIGAHSVANAGLAKLVSGCLFPFGLMMVVWTGSELFTGNCLLPIGLADGSATWGGILRNLIPVYCGNCIGAVLLALACTAGGTFAPGTALGSYALGVAVNKTALPFGAALLRGVLCNILVCAAVMFAMCAKTLPGKAIGCFAPIAAFVIAGFEHCIANAFYLPLGMLLDGSAVTFSGILHNMLPVTLGNVLGGFGFAAVMAVCHRK